MDKKEILPFGSEVKYFVSDIYAQGELITKAINSKLIRNDIKYVEPKLFLYPNNKEEHSKIIKHFELEIKGYFEFVGGEKAGEIHIPKSYLMESGNPNFASNWEEFIIKIVPYEIYEKDFLYEQQQDKEQTAEINFILTENNRVRPFGSFIRSYTGEIKGDLKPRVILNLGSDWVGKFNEYYTHTDKEIEGIDGTFSTNHLVLTLENKKHPLKSKNEAEKITKIVENLLGYLSLGSRQRTTWLKWTAKLASEYIEHLGLFLCHKNLVGSKIHSLKTLRFKNFYNVAQIMKNKIIN